MSRLIATRISDEAYAKIMGKCSGLGCSVYDYLKMLVETDIKEVTKEAKQTDEKNRQIDEQIRELRMKLEGVS
jgi:Fe-S cluster biogenesis protein NfuA